MGRRAGITREQIVEVAATIADRDGLEAATLAAVAEELGVRSPSLYHHLAGATGLRRALALRAAEAMYADLVGLVDPTGGVRPVVEMAHAIRRFIKIHPGLYAALHPAPAPEEDPELAEAMLRPVDLVADALVPLGLDAHRRVTAVRVLRAAVHGFADLEVRGGFGLPVDVDESFEAMIDALVIGVIQSTGGDSHGGGHRLAGGKTA